MKKQTILQLNNLNKEFYKTTAEEFDNSRQYYWQGWEKLLPIICRDRPCACPSTTPTKPLKILDIGCGNARFAKFLSVRAQDFAPLQKSEYTGIDNSQELLQKAKEGILLEPRNLKLETIDVIQSLLDDTLSQKITDTYDLIVLFGVMHHIPSFELRVKLIKELSEKLSPNGILVFTAWQFAKEERFQDRIVSPQKVGGQNLAPLLEENDYILDWRRGEKAYRYCHFLDEEEIEKVLKEIPKAKVIEQFYADGKSEKLNLYTILQK